MTMPSLITNHQKQVTINKLKSTYSILNNAIELARNDYDYDVNNWEMPTSYDSQELSDFFAENYLLPYLKTIKDCKDSNETMCKRLSSTGEGYKSRSFVLANGVVIQESGRRSESTDRLRVQIIMYINGYTSKPNYARDTFLVELGGGSGEAGLDKNKFWPYGYRNDLGRTFYTNSDNTSCNKTGLRSRCFALIMYDGWQIAPDYPW